MYEETNKDGTPRVTCLPGSHEQALHYHRTELHLSEATRDALETAIAHRRVGECLSELRDYEQAIEHTRRYLKMARELGSFHRS